MEVSGGVVGEMKGIKSRDNYENASRGSEQRGSRENEGWGK